MTVSSVVESWSRRNAGYESTDGRTFRFSATTAYQVVHDASDDDDTILLDSAIPRVRDTWPGKIGVFCTSVQREVVGPTFSIVTAQWLGEMGTSEGDSPILQPPKWIWTNSVTSEPVDTDAYGVPLCNSNGELLEGFTKEISDFTLTVTRNYQAINTYSIFQYLDSTNSDNFGPPGEAAWPAGTGALQQFSAEPILDGVSRYYTVTARIDFRIPYNTVPARAWWYRYRNDGLNVRSGTCVTFSGGGATKQALGFAEVASGVVTGVSLTDAGRGYTSAPTVTITDSTGGSGATATATVANGVVTSVSIGAGGSNYKARLIRAMDDNQEQPESRPVTLKADGTRERNPKNALWLERPKKQYSLPYAGLGLF